MFRCCTSTHQRIAMLKHGDSPKIILMEYTTEIDGYCVFGGRVPATLLQLADT